eukprot:scaffold47928_cov56-Attheya_sp.AAC.6
MSGEDGAPAGKRAKTAEQGHDAMIKNFTQDAAIQAIDAAAAEHKNVIQAIDAAAAEHKNVIQAIDAAAAEHKNVIQAKDAAKDAAAAEHQNVIQARDAAIQAKDAVLAAQDAAAARLSLRTLLTLETIELNGVGNKSSHVNGPHEVATATEKPFELFKLDMEQVPLESTSRILLRLMGQAYDSPRQHKPLSYNSEADVATLVNTVLLDAIDIVKYVETGIDLTVFHERSLFSGRPDILVVRASTHQLPLLVVEVKKPVVGAAKLCHQTKALGQAFDYGESQRACGHPLPLVVC